jgi:8-oxo-dGTP pyrophosphatase MutT (NUDIX family)
MVKNRAGIILIEENKLALIERHRADRHYFAFPGGGIDDGESPEQAAVREAEEELGVLVALKQKIAEVIYVESAQHYFLVEKLSGEFGAGTGEEYGEYNPKYGTYRPLWLPLTAVLVNNVLPRGLAHLVVRCAAEGWHDEPTTLFEEIL